MAKRIITAIVGIPVLFGAFYLGGYFSLAVCAFLISFGLIEYTQAVNHLMEDTPIQPFIMVAMGWIILMFAKFDYYSLMTIFMALFLMTMIGEVLLYQKRSIARPALVLFGLFYIPTLLSLLIVFETLDKGQYYFWLVFVICYTTDTAAYFIGKKLGKRKLAQSISPNKTVAGAIGGIVFCALFTILYGLILNRYFQVTLPWGVYLAVGIIGSLIAQMGDLLASLLKREANIKDYGYIIYGHGGVLDRFDSIIAVLPFLYIVYVLTNGWA